MKKPSNPLGLLSDAQLAEMVRQNNIKAFNELEIRHAPGLTRKLYNLLRNKKLVEDALQNVWLHAWEHITTGQYSENGHFSAWLSRTAYHEAINIIREEKPYAHPEPDESQEPYEEMPEGRNDEDILALRGYRTLKHATRRIVYLHGRLKMPFKEIGKKLHVKTATARQQFNRAIKKIGNYVEMMKLRKKFS